MASGLLFFSCDHENESRSIFTHRFTGPERDFDSVRHWREARIGWRNQVVRGGHSGRQLAEAGRLLAHGVCG